MKNFWNFVKQKASGGVVYVVKHNLITWPTRWGDCFLSSVKSDSLETILQSGWSK